MIRIRRHRFRILALQEISTGVIHGFCRPTSGFPVLSACSAHKRCRKTNPGWGESLHPKPQTLNPAGWIRALQRINKVCVGLDSPTSESSVV